MSAEGRAAFKRAEIERHRTALEAAGYTVTPPAAPSESSASPTGVAGHCFDADGAPWHPAGECPGAIDNCDGKCCGRSSASPEPRCRHFDHETRSSGRYGWKGGWRSVLSCWEPCPPSAPGGSSRHSDERAQLIEQIAQRLEAMIVSAAVTDEVLAFNAVVARCAYEVRRSFATPGDDPKEQQHGQEEDEADTGPGVDSQTTRGLDACAAGRGTVQPDHPGGDATVLVEQIAAHVEAIPKDKGDAKKTWRMDYATGYNFALTVVAQEIRHALATPGDDRTERMASGLPESQWADEQRAAGLDYDEGDNL